MVIGICNKIIEMDANDRTNNSDRWVFLQKKEAFLFFKYV